MSTQSKETQEASVVNLPTYESLSRRLRRTLCSAQEIVKVMYDRLTLVDRYSHSDAVQKIWRDHMDLQGFSRRNIRRYLPQDNENVPRRVRTARPKTSITELFDRPKLSSTGLHAESNLKPIQDEYQQRLNELRDIPYKYSNRINDRVAEFVAQCNEIFTQAGISPKSQG